MTHEANEALMRMPKAKFEARKIALVQATEVLYFDANETGVKGSDRVLATAHEFYNFLTTDIS